ncbi:Protein of unknown function [Jatrophihabitans endophyticus]|uniref:DUF2630 domain-containing protein n=1 Tax=Jatrophihabitans endophyticus TaxID=1206085 RepID=A0A1M5Q543_9ACTN|nr:DUF2630 family protein [Jatrophihabitans endophyticus]SHH09118.1 Protein of unknown function [Jatrophihabitans endophyticus]
MTDSDSGILHHIDELVAEEKSLRATPGGLSDEQRQRLRHVQEQLDQAWDLLRQRRAREETGEDPGSAHERSVGEVEGYLQ